MLAWLVSVLFCLLGRYSGARCTLQERALALSLEPVHWRANTPLCWTPSPERSWAFAVPICANCSKEISIVSFAYLETLERPVQFRQQTPVAPINTWRADCRDELCCF